MNNIHEIVIDELKGWVYLQDQDAKISSIQNVSGLVYPHKMSYLVSEILTDNGLTFDQQPFAPGRLDGVFRVLPNEEAHLLFDKLSQSLLRRKFVSDLIKEDKDVVVALWDIEDNQSAIFVGETNGMAMQDNWYELCRLSKIAPFEEGFVLQSQNFDSDKLLQKFQSSSEQHNQVIYALQKLTKYPEKSSSFKL